ncbi:hypothetical protein TcWFU_006391 [Taenia crassiceps]|uniref:Uncharacterized protein n=1 Tax=Taenia crassiceps TaxID=6207 RepID=A0ABR4Q6A3_9CEST
MVSNYQTFIQTWPTAPSPIRRPEGKAISSTEIELCFHESTAHTAASPTSEFSVQMPTEFQLFIEEFMKTMRQEGRGRWNGLLCLLAAI